MTDSTPPADAAAKPTGLKAMTSDVALKAYLKAPPRAQNAMLQGYTKAQPIVAKVAPHAKQLLGGGLGVLVLRRLRRRGR